MRKYIVHDDLLWFVKNEKRALFVPYHMQRRLLEEYHDSPLASHPGRDETTSAIQRTYHWPAMRKDIKNYVKSCLVCASEKRGQLQENAPLRPRTPDKPWQTISVDQLGPYPVTRGKNKYVIICTDLFTKWVEARAVPEANTKAILSFLADEVFHRWGHPEQIITDNASQFLSKEWQTTLRRLNVNHFTSPIFHQRANPVERRVQELKKILRTKNPRLSWDQHLSEALYTMRSRSNAATGTSPSELLLGYVIPRPGDWAIPVEVQPPQAPREERVRRARDRQIIYRRRLFPDPDIPPAVFEVGELVLTRKHVPEHPFDQKWTGPHPIIRKLGATTYEIDRNGAQYPVHVDDIRPAPPARRDAE